MKKEKVLVCKVCGCEVDYDSSDMKSFKEKGSDYHVKCFIDKKLVSSTIKRKGKNKIEGKDDIEKLANQLYDDFQSKRIVAKIKDDFYEYIQETYSIMLLPKSIFVKMDSITSGTYKGLAMPISIEDIYDMFRKKKNELDKIYTHNVAKGMQFNEVGRFNYDLAILISKYDTYLKWKTKEKTQFSYDDNKQKNMDKININKIMKQTNSMNKIVEQEESIDDLLDLL